MIHQGSDAEEKLLQHVQGLKEQNLGRAAIHLKLSKLRSEARRDYHVRIATHSFSDLVKRFDGHLFICGNRDIVFLCRGAKADQLTEIVYRIKYLFSGDPLLESDEEAEDFCRWYDLSVQWSELYAICERIVEEKRKREEEESSPEEEEEIEPLDAMRLARLEAGLASIDVSPFLRRQPMCRIGEDGRLRRLGDEVYVRIADLQRVAMPKVDLASSRWLFQHLTMLLDSRVMALLVREPKRIVYGPTSLNFNLETVLAPEFIRFASELPQEAREKVIVELQVIDVMSDLGLYGFARTFLHGRGFRVALDGTDYLTLPELAMPDLGADLIKLKWDAAMASDSQEELRTQLVEAIRRCGAERIVLCRCDNEDALAFGRTLGLSMFQGRHLDKLLNPARRRVN